MRCVCSSLLVLILSSALVSSKSYSGYQVWRTAPLTRENVDSLSSLLQNPKYETWNRLVVSRQGLIMVAPEHVHELRDTMYKLGLKPELYIKDVQEVLDKEKSENDAIRRTERSLQRAVTFDRYMNFTEIETYLDEVVTMYPQLVTLEVIGQSYEGRPLKILKISNNPGANKPIVYINSGIHASEWLGPPSAMYTIEQLTTFAAQNQEMLDLADWYILTVSNPDGYEFSWTDDRLWRKTRSPNAGSSCMGTDPNRNFDVHWGEGGENDTCLWNYPGPFVFSEIEVRAMANYIGSLAQTRTVALYMDLHTYGPSLLHPYGYTLDPVDNPPLVTAAQEAVLALEAVRGTHYDVGSIAEIFFLAYGNAQDYVYDVVGVPFSYTWEFVEGGATGYDPPPSEIQPIVVENWEAFKVLARHACAAAAKH